MKKREINIDENSNVLAQKGMESFQKTIEFLQLLDQINRELESVTALHEQGIWHKDYAKDVRITL